MLSQVWALCSLIMAYGLITAPSREITLEDDDGEVASTWQLVLLVALAPIVFVVQAFRRQT